MASMIRLLGAAALLSLAVAGCAPGKAGSPDNATPAAAAADGATTIPLEIATAHGKIQYHVEIAVTEQEQARGLMYRTSLPDHGGMIFPMKPARFASFWMKNTYIPLDIIFIRPNGTIARIAANAVPEKLDTIDSGEPVSAVLELAGGQAAKDGVAEGDKVRWTVAG